MQQKDDGRLLEDLEWKLQPLKWLSMHARIACEICQCNQEDFRLLGVLQTSLRGLHVNF